MKPEQVTRTQHRWNGLPATRLGKLTVHCAAITKNASALATQIDSNTVATL